MKPAPNGNTDNSRQTTAGGSAWPLFATAAATALAATGDASASIIYSGLINSPIVSVGSFFPCTYNQHCGYGHSGGANLGAFNLLGQRMFVSARKRLQRVWGAF